MRVRRGPMLAIAALALPLGAAGCGGDDFPNDPRPPAPIEVTANVTNKAITVAPSQFGAGLVNLTISNTSDNVVSLNIKGGQIDTSADPIDPNSVGNFKLKFTEGSYEVTAGDDSSARPTELVVGSERASSQNQLLLP